MKRLITRLILSALLTYAGWNLMNKNTEYVLPEELTEGEYFCNNAIETNGFLENEYQVTTVKVMHVPVKRYTYKFTYLVSGNTFTGTFTSDEMLNSLGRKIWYDRNDPSKNRSFNPCEAYAILKTKKVSNYRNWFFYFGLPLILIGPAMFLGAIKGFFIGLFRGNRT